MKTIISIISCMFLMTLASQTMAQVDTSYRNKRKTLPDSLTPPQEKMPTQTNPGTPAPMPNSQNNNGNTVPMPTQPLPPTQQTKPVNPARPNTTPKKTL